MLTSKEAAAAFGTSDFEVSGSKTRYYGAAKFLLDIDICSWQRTKAGPDPNVLQVQVDTTGSSVQAKNEFAAFVKLIAAHYPGSVPKPLTGLGEEAVFVAGWEVSRKGSEVLEVTTGGDSFSITLQTVAKDAAKGLHWS